MADWKNITKEQFLAAYNHYPPNKWTKFAFKYFSKSTEKEDMKLSNWVGIILGLLFLIGFFGTVFGLPRTILGPVVIGYSLLLAVLVLSLFIAVWMNNARLKKVMKLLGVTKQEYNRLADKFFE